MALALYRKYRPRTFAEVIGQEHVTEPLSQALRSGRLHHAYLFSGPRGCGKTSSARILARSLNCEQGPTPEPCGVCASCRSLMSDGAGSIDVIEIDAASHGGVDDARDLREKAFFAPANSRYKIYVIDEAHMVSSAGFNALLKLVEEPPEYVKFIFATTEPEKVLGTIRSRTHHYPFRLIPPAVLRPYLQQLTEAEGVSVEPAVFPLVVKAGGGSARDSLSVLDQLISGSGPDGVSYSRAVALLGVTDVALLDEMCDALAAGDGAAAYATIDRVAEAGHDPRRFASDLLERLRDLIVLQQVPDAVAKGLIDGPADQLEAMAAQATRLGPATLSRCADIVHNGLVEMRGTTAPRLLLELVTARMLLPGAEDSTGALLQRLERMERRLTLSGDPAPVPVRDEHAPLQPVSAALSPADPAVGGSLPGGGSLGSGSAGGRAGGGGLSAARAAAAAASRRSSGGVVAAGPAAAGGGQGESSGPEGANPDWNQVADGAAPDARPSGDAVDDAVVRADVDSAEPSAGDGPDSTSTARHAPEPEFYDDEPPWEDEPEPEPEPYLEPNARPADRAAPADYQASPRSGASLPENTAPVQHDPGLQGSDRSLKIPGASDSHSKSQPGVQSQSGSQSGSQSQSGPQSPPRTQAEPGLRARPEVQAQPGLQTQSAAESRPARRTEPAGVLPDAPEEPGAAAVAAAVPGRLDVTAVREVWPEIITAIGRKSKKIAALASGATVREFDGQTVVLTFRFPAHARMVAPEGPLISNALYEALGGRWQVRCDVVGEGAARESDQRESSQPESGRSDSAGGESVRNNPSHDAARNEQARNDSVRNEQARAAGPRPVQAGAPQAQAQAQTQATQAAPRAPQTRRPAAETAPAPGGDDDWPEPARLGGAAAGVPSAPTETTDDEDGWPEVRAVGTGNAGGGTPSVDAAGGADHRAADQGVADHGAADHGADGDGAAGHGAAGGGAVWSGAEPVADFTGGDRPAGYDIGGSPNLGHEDRSSSTAIGAGPQVGAHATGSVSGGGGPAISAATGASGGAGAVDSGAASSGAAHAAPASPGNLGPAAAGSATPGAVGSGGPGGGAGGNGPRMAERGRGLAAARAAAAGARNAAAARQGAKQGGQQAWADGSPTEDAPYDPEYDGSPPGGGGSAAGRAAPAARAKAGAAGAGGVAAGGVPAGGAVPNYEGFDPGDEPLDVMIDEKTARESSEQQAMRLLQEAFGAEKIGES